MDTRKAVSPDHTLFRPGSASKLFTWTAVMQLVEQGKLNLDRDINDYLDFKIPTTYPEPITLRNIMTHTSGFGETIKDLFVNDVHDLTSLRTYVSTHIPRRIFPPGKVPAYSNYATALAGYIVERVSRRPFNDYIHDNILKPLGMERTTFEQPLPESIKPLMSNGYILASQKAKPFELVQAWPAGSVSTTARDMARFMIAHLQNGEFGGARILRPETAALMHSRQFSLNPALNGMALGFYEETRNGHRIIGHGGDSFCFHTDLHLMVNDGVGFFVSYNSRGKGTISNRTAVWHKFLDRYFPYSNPGTPALSSAAADAREVSGHYIVSRRWEGNLIEALNMVEQAEVSANLDGTISISNTDDLNGRPKKFREVQPLVYQDLNGQDRVAFQPDFSGRLTFATDFPVFLFQRAGFLQLGSLNLLVLIASTSVMLLSLLLWPVAAMARKHFGRRLSLGKRERRLRVMVRLVCGLNLCFLLGMLLFLSSLNESLPTSHLTPKLHFLQLIGLLGALGTGIVVCGAVEVWRPAASPVAAKATAATGVTGAAEAATSRSSAEAAPQPRWWGVKISETLIAMACIGFLWIELYWNLLNMSSNF
jgi:CubicO group peptidase (beta-lactamase class C family)